MINVINEKILTLVWLQKNPKLDLSLFLRDWYHRCFEFHWEEEPGVRFNCRINKRVLFLIREFRLHRCGDTDYYDYKPSDFYLANKERDSSYEDFMLDIASNKQIETRELNNLNPYFTKRCDKNEVTLNCRKCNPKFICQDDCKLNSDEMPPLTINDGYLYVEDEIF